MKTLATVSRSFAHRPEDPSWDYPYASRHYIEMLERYLATFHLRHRGWFRNPRTRALPKDPRRANLGPRSVQTFGRRYRNGSNVNWLNASLQVDRSLRGKFGRCVATPPTMGVGFSLDARLPGRVHRAQSAMDFCSHPGVSDQRPGARLQTDLTLPSP